MKFALVNGERIEATKGATGYCPMCGSELIAKCGEIKVNHWSHKSKRTCDIWWENETEWHRTWKNQFPQEWQEIVHFDRTGEKHIADVKTESGWILEFQHSYINPEERRARNQFYNKLAWIVNGARRKTDVKQFERLLSESTVKCKWSLFEARKVSFPEECRLIKEWYSKQSLVFIDFQQELDDYIDLLWLIIPEVTDKQPYISTFPKDLFIKALQEDTFDIVLRDIIKNIQAAINSSRQRARGSTLRQLPISPKYPFFSRNRRHRRL